MLAGDRMGLPLNIVTPGLQHGRLQLQGCFSGVIVEGSPLLSFQPVVEALLGLDQLAEQVVEDLAHRGLLAEVTEHLPDRVGEEVVGAHPLHPRAPLLPPQVLLGRGGEGGRGVGTIPGVAEGIAQGAAGFGGDGGSEHRVTRFGLEHLALDLGKNLALHRLQPQRAGPHTLTAQHQSRGELATASDSAGSEHRQRGHRVHNARPQHHQRKWAPRYQTSRTSCYAFESSWEGSLARRTAALIARAGWSQSSQSVAATARRRLRHGCRASVSRRTPSTGSTTVGIPGSPRSVDALSSARNCRVTRPP